MGIKGKEPMIAKNDGIQSYGNLVSFAESPKKAGLFYTGSDDGVLSVSRDDGANWVKVNSKIPGLPPNTYVSEVTPSRFEEGTVYATFDGHRLNDFKSYVYLSRDYGQSWQSITGDLPRGQVARTITEDLKNPELLYLGTETGLFITHDRGRSWVRFKANLPTVPIYEITLHPRDNAMILATHGRGIWILDDLTSLQQFTKARATDAYLFESKPAQQRNLAGDRNRDFEGDMQFLGKNPDPGAAINYYLKSRAKSLSLVVKDSGGNIVREIFADKIKGKTDAGVDTINWDLRVEPLPPPRTQPQGQGGGGGGGGGGLNGPYVLPGRYQLTLKVDGKDLARQEVSVEGDPEITIADADRRAMFDTAMELHRMQRVFNEASDRVSAMNESIRTMQQALNDNKESPEALKARVEEIAKKLAPVTRRFGIGQGGAGAGASEGGFASQSQSLRFRLNGLKGGVMASTSLPTETQSRQIPGLRSAIDKAIQEANLLIADLPALQKAVPDWPQYPEDLSAPQHYGRGLQLHFRSAIRSVGTAGSIPR